MKEDLFPPYQNDNPEDISSADDFQFLRLGWNY